MSYNRTNTFNNQISRSRNAYMVAKEYRTNPKSKIAGGDTVKVKYRDGSSRIYDNIKNTEAYINHIKSCGNDEITDVYVMS